MNWLEQLGGHLARATRASRRTVSPYPPGLVAQLTAIAAMLESPPVLVVVGEASAGKSNLINYLLERDVLPVDILPTTALPTLIRFGEREGCVVTRRSGPTDLLPLEALGRYQQGPGARLGKIADGVTSIEVILRCEPLQRHRLLDTRAVSASEGVDDRTQTAVRDALGVIWCTHVSAAWSDSERRSWKALQMRTLRMTDASMKNSFLEANRWNREIVAAARARRLV